MPNRRAETARERAGRLYDEFGESLYRYAVILLADAGAAEDAIQQVFAALLRQRGTIDNEAHYLRRAIRNECYSMLRGRIREQGLPHSLLEPVAKEGADHVERLALERAGSTWQRLERLNAAGRHPATPSRHSRRRWAAVTKLSRQRV